MTPDQYQAARKRLGLTHETLATLLGIHPTTSRMYGTRDQAPVTIERLLTLIEWFGPERYRDVLGLQSRAE
jgi:DNA-binding transcriptional regulator YiaG